MWCSFKILQYITHDIHVYTLKVILWRASHVWVYTHNTHIHTNACICAEIHVHKLILQHKILAVIPKPAYKPHKYIAQNLVSNQKSQSQCHETCLLVLTKTTSTRHRCSKEVTENIDKKVHSGPSYPLSLGCLCKSAVCPHSCLVFNWELDLHIMRVIQCYLSNLRLGTSL